MRALGWMILAFIGGVQAAPDYTIVRTNEDTRLKHEQQLPAARQYLNAIAEEVKGSEKVLARYRSEGLGPEVPAQARRFSALGAQGHALFGSDLLAEPFGRCGFVGDAAWNHWQSQVSGDRRTVQSDQKLLRELMRECRHQIKTAPPATVTIRTQPIRWALGDKAPIPRCLALPDLTSPNTGSVTDWTCPASAVRR